MSLVVAVFAGLAISTQAVSFAFGPAAASRTCTAVCIALGLIQIGVLVRNRRSQQASRGVEHWPTPSEPARLDAYGRPDELLPLAAIEDVPREAAIFRRIPTFLGWSTERWGVLGVFLVGASVFAVRAWVVTVVAMSIVATLWLLSQLRPTYYRVVPGRLDILVGSPFSGKVRLAGRWNLRDALVKIRFDQQELFVRSWAAKRTLCVGSISEPHAFVRAVFEAAISSHPTASLPDDALLG